MCLGLFAVNNLTDRIMGNVAASFAFIEGDTPSTTVTPRPPLQKMSNSRGGEVRTGAGQSTGKNILNRTTTGNHNDNTRLGHMTST